MYPSAWKDSKYTNERGTTEISGKVDGLLICSYISKVSERYSQAYALQMGRLTSGINVEA